jgi:hypothetical protein
VRFRIAHSGASLCWASDCPRVGRVTTWRYLSGSWARLRSGQVVWVRRRGLEEIEEITIERTLVDQLDGNGAGIRDADGRTLRRFLYDLSIEEPAEIRGTRAVFDEDVTSDGVVLTPRQLTIISLYVNGYTKRRIASVLGASHAIVHDEIARARDRYTSAGYDVSTKAGLHQMLEEHAHATARPRRGAARED